MFGGDETTALEHNNECFKLAAEFKISNEALSEEEKLILCLKYQVLGIQTFYFGVIKQNKMSALELGQIEI